jgi:hypothetical protein
MVKWVQVRQGKIGLGYETYLNTSDLSPCKAGSSAGVSSCSYTPSDRSSYTFVDRIDIAIAPDQPKSRLCRETYDK